MPVASFTKFYSFVEAVAEKAHNLGADSLKVMLVNSPAPSQSNTKKADLTEIAAGNGYTAGGTVATIASSAQSSGLYKLVLNDVVFTSSTGSMGPFRYAVLYNDTDAVTPKGLIGFWDNGANVTLNGAAGETFTVDYDPTSGVLTLT